jgi:hypothetical protein
MGHANALELDPAPMRNQKMRLHRSRLQRTGMFGRRLLGVYTAAKGMTHFVASSLLFGQMFQVSRTPSMSSS